MTIDDKYNINRHLSEDMDSEYKKIFSTKMRDAGLFFIYKFTCKINNKIYIGQTNYPRRRYYCYMRNALAKNNSQVIYRAMTKYGFDNFDFEIIATCKTRKDLNHTEIQIIEQYNSRNYDIGYNTAKGGGYIDIPVTDETRKKISNGLQLFYANNPSPNIGNKHSEESKKLMSEISMGKPGTLLGKSHSQEWNAKISASNIGKVFSEETIKKLSDSHLGKIPPNRKFTDVQIKEMRKLFNEEKVAIRKLARDYNVSGSTMTAIVKMRTYKNV